MTQGKIKPTLLDHQSVWFMHVLSYSRLTSLRLLGFKGAGYLSFAIVLLAALVCRFGALSSLPGLSGDEAWYGVQAQKILAHSIPTLRTSSGNILDPFFIGPTTIAEGLFGRSVVTLRFSAVLSGGLAIVLAFLLFRRSLNPTTAMVLASLVAWCPVEFMFSRLALETCGTTLVSLIVLHFAFSGRWVQVAAACAAASIIHPSNILLYGPVLALLTLYLLDRRSRANPIRAALGLGTLILLPVLVVRFQINPHSVPWTSNPHAAPLSMQAVASQHTYYLHDPRAWADLFVYYGRLISGITSYEGMLGPVSTSVAFVHVIFFWLLAGLIALPGGWRLSRAGDHRFMALLAGTAVSIGASYFAFGLVPLLPGTERYSLCLVAPTLVLLAMGLSVELPVGRAFLRVAPVLVLSAVSLAMNYFDPFLSTGGTAQWSYRAFRTSTAEPKAQVATLLTQDRGVATNRRSSCGKSLIISEDWWIAWPLQYLLLPQDFEVVNLDGKPLETDDVDRALDDGAYIVLWAGGPLESQYAPLVLHDHVTISDRGGRSLLTIWHEPATQNSSDGTCPAKGR